MNNRGMKKLYPILSLLVFLLLAGCQKPSFGPTIAPEPAANRVVQGVAVGTTVGIAASVLTGEGPLLGAAAIGGITGGAIGSYLHQKTTLLSELQRNGVHVIQIGDDIMLVLPSDIVFYKRSPNLNAAYFPVLNGVARFMRQYPKITVKVAGFTDSAGSPQANLVLSQQQATNMVDYLWKHDPDARLLYSIGYGANYPISHNVSGTGRSQNRRIEITFRKLPILS